jgi:colanic acid biosynthesis glycosyl transferase WcaI
VVVPPEDAEALAAAILELYQNPEQVNSLGYNSRKFAVENYSFDNALNQYESLFHAVVKQNIPQATPNILHRPLAPAYEQVFYTVNDAEIRESKVVSKP